MTTTLNPAASVLCSCGCGQPVHPGSAQRGVRYLRGHKTSPQAGTTAVISSPVVLSGRCGSCGYLRESAGHEITCG